MRLPLSLRVWFPAGFRGSKREQWNHAFPPRVCVTAQGQAQPLCTFTPRRGQPNGRQIQPEKLLSASPRSSQRLGVVWSLQGAPEAGLDPPAGAQLPLTFIWTPSWVGVTQADGRFPLWWATTERRLSSLFLRPVLLVELSLSPVYLPLSEPSLMVVANWPWNWCCISIWMAGAVRMNDNKN